MSSGNVRTNVRDIVTAIFMCFFCVIVMQINHMTVPPGHLCWCLYIAVSVIVMWKLLTTSTVYKQMYFKL